MSDFEIPCKNCKMVNNYSPNKEPLGRDFFICKNCEAKNIVHAKTKGPGYPSTLFVAKYIPKGT